MLPGANTFWTDLFVRHFLFETNAPIQESDDLLFFVRYKHVKGSSRVNPKYEVHLPFQFICSCSQCQARTVWATVLTHVSLLIS